MRSLALLTALFLLLPAAPSLAAGDWAWPVHGEVLTPYRNGDDPYAAGQHRGIDLGAPVGTPVVAASGGTVEFAGVVGSSGLVVSERTGDGRYELSYLHLSSLAVRRGDRVARGDRLGAVGVSGTRSVEAPHLHFGVRAADDRHAYLDPLTFLAPEPPARAPEPRPGPAPVDEPAVAPPAAAPVAVPAAVGRPSPAAAPAHAGHPAPHARPGAALGHVLTPAPARGAQPAAAPKSLASVHHAPAHRASAAPPHGPATAPLHRAPITPGHAAGRHPHGGGVNLGWLAACIGLVVAAALLAPRVRLGTPPVGFEARWPTTSRPRSTT
jgi:hypothetical protein